MDTKEKQALDDLVMYESLAKAYELFPEQSHARLRALLEVANAELSKYTRGLGGTGNVDFPTDVLARVCDGFVIAVQAAERLGHETIPLPAGQVVATLSAILGLFDAVKEELGGHAR